MRHWKDNYLRFRNKVKEIVTNYDIKSACEIGAWKWPFVDYEEIKAHGIDLTIVDIDQNELDQIPGTHFRTICADASTAEFSEQFELVVSYMVIEHIHDVPRFHRNVYKMLRHGGLAFHGFPTLYYPAIVLNKYLPEKATNFLAFRFTSREKKFPAYYSWCYGPTRRMLRFLDAFGYEVIEYITFYGTDYFDSLPVLRWFDRRTSVYLANKNSCRFCSHAHVLLRKK